MSPDQLLSHLVDPVKGALGSDPFHICGKERVERFAVTALGRCLESDPKPPRDLHVVRAHRPDLRGGRPRLGFAAHPGGRSVSAASIRSSRPAICLSCSSVGVAAPEDAWSRRERDTKVLVMAAVMTVRKPIPTSITSAATSRPATLVWNVVPVPDRRDRLDGPPEPGSDRREVLAVGDRHQYSRPDRDRGRHRGDHDGRPARPRSVGHDDGRVAVRASSRLPSRSSSRRRSPSCGRPTAPSTVHPLGMKPRPPH